MTVFTDFSAIYAGIFPTGVLDLKPVARSSHESISAPL